MLDTQARHYEFAVPTMVGLRLCLSPFITAGYSLLPEYKGEPLIIQGVRQSLTPTAETERPADQQTSRQNLTA